MHAWDGACFVFLASSGVGAWEGGAGDVSPQLLIAMLHSQALETQQ